MPPQQYGPPPGQYPGWPPAGPPKKSNGLKWVLVGVALIAVIAVAVAITAVVLRSDSGADGKAGSSSISDIASANDTGPVAVITDEPTCDKFMSINDGLANQQHNGWDQRDASIPATDWTPDQHAQYQAAGNAFRNAADQLVPLAKETPHRVVREIYEQFIAFARAYASSIGTYTASDDFAARTAIDATNSVKNICHSISQGAAGTWGPSVPAAKPPMHPANPTDLAQPQPFLTGRDSVCGDWIALKERYNTDLAPWSEIDPEIPATAWNPEQKSTIDAATVSMSEFADNIEQLAGRSSSPVLQDFAAFSAQYLRAYVKSTATFVSSDAYLAYTAHAVATMVQDACKATGG